MKLLLTAAVLTTSAAYAHADSRTVIHASTIKIDNNGQTQELKLSKRPAEISIVDGNQTVYLLAQDAKNTPIEKCSEYSFRITEDISILANVDNKMGRIFIPARGAVAFYTMGCDKTGRPVGIQIDLKDRSKQILVDTTGDKYKTAVQEAAAETVVVKAALDDFSAKVNAGDFAEARRAYSKARNMTLLPAELVSLLQTRASLPENEQPINTTKDFVSKDLSRLVGQDVDAMTKVEYVDFFTKYFSTFRNEQHDVDDTYAFRLFDVTDIPADQATKVLVEAVDVNLDGIIAFARAGGDEKALNFTPQYIAAQGLLYLSFTMEQSKFEAYYAGVRSKVQAAMASDAYVAKFLKRAYFDYNYNPTR